MSYLRRFGLSSMPPKRFLQLSPGIVGELDGGNRGCSSFVRDAYINIQQQSSNIPHEQQALYSEVRVRQWLEGFKGGRVHLEKCQDTGLATIVLDYPERRNALTGRMMVELSDAVHDLESWPSGRVLLVRGRGGQFCSGGELNFVNQIADPLSGSKMCIFMQSVTGRLHRLPLISFALIEGYAVGGGAELASACDFRLFRSDAKMGFIQARALGVNTGWGGGTHLTRQVGPRVALRLLAAGETIGAEEAYRIGLADQIIDDDHDDRDQKKSTVDDALQPYLQTDRNAAIAFKRIVINADQCSYTESMNRERDIFAGGWGAQAHLAALRKLMAGKGGK